jgi:hypothetical protein
MGMGVESGRGVRERGELLQSLSDGERMASVLAHYRVQSWPGIPSPLTPKGSDSRLLPTKGVMFKTWRSHIEGVGT